MAVIEDAMLSTFGAHLTERLLPRLQLRFLAPAPALRPFIKHYWFAATPSKGKLQHRTYPDGGMGFVFDLTHPEHSYFEGPRRVTMPLQLLEKSAYVGVRFAVGGICQFMRNFSEHSNQQTPVSYLPEYRSLLALLVSTRSLAQQVTILDHFFIDQARRLDSRIVAQKEWLLALLPADGPIKMKNVSEQLGVTLRHFDRLIKLASGYSPKQLATTLRVDAVRRTLISNPDQDILDLVYRLGYHDQAHLIKEFRVHTQTTPNAYQRKKQRQREAASRAGNLSKV